MASRTFQTGGENPEDIHVLLTAPTGITVEAYRQAVREGGELSHVCDECITDPRHMSEPTEIPTEQDSTTSIDVTTDSNSNQHTEVYFDDVDDVTDSNNISSSSIYINTSFADPQEITERSLVDPPIPSESVTERPFTYEIIKAHKKEKTYSLIHMVIHIK